MHNNRTWPVRDAWTQSCRGVSEDWGSRDPWSRSPWSTGFPRGPSRPVLSSHPVSSYTTEKRCWTCFSAPHPSLWDTSRTLVWGTPWICCRSLDTQRRWRTCWCTTCRKSPRTTEPFPARGKIPDCTPTQTAARRKETLKSASKWILLSTLGRWYGVVFSFFSHN